MLENAPDFDVVVLAGDHLELSSLVDRRAQSVVVGGNISAEWLSSEDFHYVPIQPCFSEEPDETDPQATARDVTMARASLVATHATFYIVSVWLISYATAKLGYGGTTILTATRL